MAYFGPLSRLSRRSLLKGAVIGAAANALHADTTSAWGVSDAHPSEAWHLRQSVSRWCYQRFSLEELCKNAAELRLDAIDLLEEDEWEIPRRYGLVCSMGYGGGGEIGDALNRVENHAKIEAAFRKSIPRAAKAGVENVITFSGNRRGMSDEQGARNVIAGLNRIKKIGEDHGVTICMELLNSKVDHHDYMCDRSAWGVRVVQEVNSLRVKLLYDIYHMQIMEGDLIRTITNNIEWIGHFHTGGVPGRHELDNTQEVNWAGVMRAIAAANFRGFVGHEFIPTRDPFRSLGEAVELCGGRT
jgi:hydroxypyruvate isomerase